MSVTFCIENPEEKQRTVGSDILSVDTILIYIVYGHEGDIRRLQENYMNIHRQVGAPL